MADSQLYSGLSSDIISEVSKESSVWVVIPAAGSGQRMNSEIPKQYLKIHSKTILEHTIDCFLQSNSIAGIVIVLSPDDQYWQSLNIQSNTFSKPIYTIEGGSDRSSSVSNGLAFLEEVGGIATKSWVMIHDAARPCLSQTDLNSLLNISETDSIGGLLATPVRDTMKRAVNNQENDSSIAVAHTEYRDNLWHALTPQMFHLGALRAALRHCVDQGLDITDECSAMEHVGEHPTIVECINNNIKITQANDIKLAEFLLGEISK